MGNGPVGSFNQNIERERDSSLVYKMNMNSTDLLYSNPYKSTLLQNPN